MTTVAEFKGFLSLLWWNKLFIAYLNKVVFFWFLFKSCQMDNSVSGQIALNIKEGFQAAEK